MDYKEKLKDLILNGTQIEFSKWLKSHEPFDQVEIMRQLKELSIENMFEANDYSIAPTLQSFEEKIIKYQDAILDVINVKKEVDKALNEVNKMKQEIIDRMAARRRFVIEAIITNAENAEEMKEMAKKIIEFEQNLDIYNPENWKAIL